MSVSTNDSPAGFDLFGFHSTLIRGLEAAGFEDPRPIQVETIPAALTGRDVLGLAQTGTGKTAAFALPLLDRFVHERAPGPRALILAPTRELATQIDAEIRSLARYTRVKAVTVFGGVSAHGQIKALRANPEIVVGCPGRVLDLIGQGVLQLRNIEALVLDEADHMFDMGFLPDLRRILKSLPANRQNLLFSATMPTEIRKLADGLLRDPHVAQLSVSGPAETIDHALLPIREDRKRDLLERILSEESCESAIVFTRTKHRAKRIARQLDQSGHRAISLQGNMSQSQRDRAMKGFRKGQYDVLVATDIVARGIDVQGVSHVINFDVPNTPEAYTHRTGRTGRSENEGRALTFTTREDLAWLRATERKLGAPIDRRVIEGFESDSDELKKKPEKSSQTSRGAGSGRSRAAAPPRRNRSRRPGRPAHA
ncbi:MAG: DEAD/DEAH box helicase [Myxococcota bacterium]|nr:DEAD/DEAH box helicase [Myxococcota bacterium]